MHSEKRKSRKTKSRVATSNPQLSLADSLLTAYETAQRSVTRHDRRRERRSGPCASAVRRALDRRVRRCDLARGAVVGARRELHARAWKANGQLDVARAAECDLLVRVGALHADDRLAVAAFPVRAARPR